MNSNSNNNNITTNFAEDSTVEVLSFPKMSEDDITVRDTAIPDFLAKPFLVSQLSWNISSLSNALLFSSSVSTMLNSNTYWTNKTQAFNLLRGTFCVRVSINASPFQQGRLLLHYLPAERNMSLLSPAYVPMHNATIATKTTQPSIELDCRSTVAIMKIPYVGPFNFYEVKTAKYDWGTFYISVLSPLLTGALGENTIDVATHVWFEDFELAAPLVPQMKMSLPKKKKNKSYSVVAGESKMAAMGPLQSTLSTVGTIAGALGTIPVLAPLCATVEWAADIGAGIASIFGWSKPVLTIVPGIMAKQTQRYSATADGADTSMPLALTYNNRIKTTDCCSIRDNDEMSFPFLKQVASLTAVASWSDTALAGTNIYSHLIGPNNLFESSTKVVGLHTAGYRSGPPIYTLSNLFRFWRGGIKVRISIPKTDFHSGRLQITWTPSSLITATPTLSTAVVSLREIVDIREGNEFEFVLPFYMGSNYLETANANIFSSVYSGQLDVVVLNALRSPETASSNVNLLFYFSGADDFEFQCPQSGPLMPFSPQMDKGESAPVIVKEVIGGDPVHTLDTLTSELSIGEHFMSIKQLLSRYNLVNSSTAISGSVLTNSSLTYWPYHTNVTSLYPGTGTLNNQAIGGDAYTYLSPMYAFYRGGMRVMVNPVTTGNAIAVMCDPLKYPSGAPCVGVTFTPGSGYFGNSNWPLVGNSAPYSCGLALSDGVLGEYYQVPYYAPTHCSLNVQTVNVTPLPAINACPVDFSQSRGNITIVPIGGTLDLTKLSMFRACADDFQFMYFIGTVPVLQSYV